MYILKYECISKKTLMNHQKNIYISLPFHASQKLGDNWFQLFHHFHKTVKSFKASLLSKILVTSSLTASINGTQIRIGTCWSVNLKKLIDTILFTQITLGCCTYKRTCKNSKSRQEIKIFFSLGPNEQHWFFWSRKFANLFSHCGKLEIDFLINHSTYF